MRKFKFDKLVRDKIVDGIIAAGNKPEYRVLEQDEFVEELKKKLLEEAKELPDSEGREKILKELADVQEVIDHLVVQLSSSKDELSKLQARKNTKAGSFERRLFVDTVEAKEDSEWIDYFLASPEKYPKISD